MIVRTKIAAALSVALLSIAGTATAEVTLYDYTEAIDRVISSANRNLGMAFNAGGTLNRGSAAGASSESNYIAAGSVTADNYFRPNSKGLFWYGSGEAGIKKGADKPFTKVGVGLGFGRAVNVTPMAKAMRLIEALREQGAW